MATAKQYLLSLDHECQTGAPRAKCDPRRNALWPAKGFCGTVRIPGLRIWSSKNCFQNKSFRLKLRGNSHEVMVDNYYKSRAALQVTVREGVAIFFRGGESASFRAASNDFLRSLPGEVVNSK